MVIIQVATLNGNRRIAYTNKTQFLVEVGKGNKGSYKVRFNVIGDLGRAVMLYNGINVGNGYKKRLRAPSFNKPILAIQWSYDYEGRSKRRN